jgi:sec-independent protein translocase protein TatA
MGGTSWMHWLVVGIVILILFGGRGRISELMGDLAKGIKSFRKGLSEDEQKPLPGEQAQNQGPAGVKPQAETKQS